MIQLPNLEPNRFFKNPKFFDNTKSGLVRPGQVHSNLLSNLSINITSHDLNSDLVSGPSDIRYCWFESDFPFCYMLYVVRQQGVALNWTAET
jgi:hypothetical protein